MNTAQAQIEAGANVQAQAQGRHVGYVRVSSTGQNTARQLDGVQVSYTFEDKQSGKDIDRPQLKACLMTLLPGDTLHVHSIDRLARSLSDLLNIVKGLTAKGVGVVFHKEGLHFTGASNAMNDLMLSMLGAVAQFERSLIAERRAEGVAIAKRKGVKFGRPSKLTLAQRDEIIERVNAGNVNKKALAAEYGISRTVLYDIIAEAAKTTA